MNNFDEEAFVREMQHKEMLSKQQVAVGTIGAVTKDVSLVGAIKHFYEIKDDDNE